MHMTAKKQKCCQKSHAFIHVLNSECIVSLTHKLEDSHSQHYISFVSERLIILIKKNVCFINSIKTVVDHQLDWFKWVVFLVT